MIDIIENWYKKGLKTKRWNGDVQNFFCGIFPKFLNG
jgi:hypothetical protein